MQTSWANVRITLTSRCYFFGVTFILQSKLNTECTFNAKHCHKTQRTMIGFPWNIFTSSRKYLYACKVKKKTHNQIEFQGISFIRQ